jgi:hypothetical protein
MPKETAHKKGKTFPMPLVVINESSTIPETLALLAQKRIGGSVNQKGIHFKK